MGYPEASWRKMKVCDAAVPKPLTLEIRGHNASDWYDHRSDMSPPYLSWKLQGDETLECVFAMFCEYLRVMGGLSDQPGERGAQLRIDQTQMKARRALEQRSKKEGTLLRHWSERVALLADFRDETTRLFGAIGKQREQDTVEASLG